MPCSMKSGRSCALNRRLKILFLQTCAAVVVFCVVCYTCMQSAEQPLESGEIGEHTKVILLWTPYFTQRDWLPSTSDLDCPTHCEVTSNRSLLPSSSAVLLHWRNIDPRDPPPGGRRGPALVLFNQEAPPHTPWSLVSELDVHWTATYRRDSQIYAPYGEIVKRTEAYKMPELDSNRSLICWLVSNCNTPSNREAYVNNLKQHVDVQVYGKCGNKTCPHHNSMDCYKWLGTRCKFYLSFENSICKDYATEKLYHAMMTDMVPVVLGGADYARILPAHSYINAADYSSPEALATYLEEVGADYEKYLAYFNWKKDHEARVFDFRWLCGLCERLHEARTRLEPYRGFRDWWFEAANCGSWSRESTNGSSAH